MVAFLFLILGLLCAITSRVLLIIAAVQISVWWAIGVILPFGPMVFRLNYPELAPAARMFRLATLPCFFFYILLGPGPAYRHYLSKVSQASAQPAGYGLEKRSKQAGQPKVELAPSIQDRRTANADEFKRLQTWAEALRLRKRDLLHSDTEGNRQYSLELEDYNVALVRATAERNTLSAPNK